MSSKTYNIGCTGVVQGGVFPQLGTHQSRLLDIYHLPNIHQIQRLLQMLCRCQRHTVRFLGFSLSRLTLLFALRTGFIKLK